MGDSWEQTVEELLAAEGERLPGGNWPDSECRFWHLGFNVDRETLAVAISAIRQKIVTGAPRRSLPYVALLLHLLRTELPAVRANRLWPDVAALINGPEQDEPVARERCAEFFRDCLRRSFRTALAQQQNYHKYVGLLLDEAGVGFDRARIIGDCLSRLLEETIGTAHDDETMRRMLQDVLKADDRPDVVALEPVLLRAGMALLRVQRALLDEADPMVVRKWTWADLCQFALGVAGEPLAYLIPEAESVFSALIPRLGKRISCENAFELAHQGGTVVQFPPTYDAASAPQRAEDVPLGTIYVVRGGSRQAVTTVDGCGNGFEIITRIPPDKWTPGAGGRHASIWRPDAFFVERTGSGRALARAVCGPQGRVGGYAWSGTTWPGDTAIARSSVSGTPSVPMSRAPSIRPVVRWLWQDSRLILRVPRVAYFDVNEGAVISVECEGKPLCQEVAAERNGALEPSESFERYWNTVDDVVTLALRIAGKVCVEAMVRMEKRPFAVIDGVVYRLRDLGRAHLSGRGTRDVLLLGDLSSEAPECSSGSLSKAPKSVTVPDGLVAFVWTGDVTTGLTGLSWGDTEAAGGTAVPRMDVDASREIATTGYRIRSTGNVWPVIASSSAAMDVLVWDIPAGRSATLKLTCGPLILRKVIAGDSRISLRELLSQAPPSGIQHLAGLGDVSLEYDGRTTPHRIAVYFAPDRVEADPVRVGGAARARFLGSGGAAFELYGKVRTGGAGVEAVAPLTFPDHGHLEPGSGVLLFWSPEVFDIHLKRADGTVDEHELSLSTLRTSSIDAEGDISKWTFDISLGGTYRTISGAGVRDADNLETALGEALAETSCEGLTCTHGTLSAVYGMAAVQSWRVALDLSLRAMSVELVPSADTMRVNIGLEWTGLPAGLVRCVIRDGSAVLAQTECPMRRATGAGLKCSASLALEVPLAHCVALADGAEWTVSAVEVRSGQTIGERSVAVPVLAQTGSDIPGSIRSLLRRPASSEAASAACRQVFVLFHEFILRAGTAPFPPEALAAQVERVLSEADCAGTAATGIRTEGRLLDSGGIPSLRPRATEEPTKFGLVLNETLSSVLERESSFGQLLPASVVALQNAVRAQIAGIRPGSTLKAGLERLSERCDALRRH